MNRLFVVNSILVASIICSVQAIGPLGAFGGLGVGVGSSKCDPSITTASGTYAMHKGNTRFRSKFQEKSDQSELLN